jgi:hypothetical protein
MRHIASLSGGWDSSVMWLFLTGYLPGYMVAGVEGAFVDPGKERAATYQVLDALDALTGVPITRLRGPSWDEALEKHKWFLPFHHARWCTEEFKITPFLEYIGDDQVISYIGLRADEPDRRGYLGDNGDNVTPCYPLREMGITKADVISLGREAGLPEPAEWSCSCCPFRPHVMWVKTVEEMPETAEWCAWVEGQKQENGAGGYTWVRGYTMRQLIDDPVLRSQIRRRYWSHNDHQSQQELGWNWDEELEATPCLMCQVK